jgi:hypothetical protein
MATPGIARQARDPRMTALHASAFTIAVLSGTCAVVALVAGSPLEFGVALALCGAGWIAADFIEWTVEGERADRRSRISGLFLLCERAIEIATPFTDEDRNKTQRG